MQGDEFRLGLGGDLGLYVIPEDSLTEDAKVLRQFVWQSKRRPSSRVEVMSMADNTPVTVSVYAKIKSGLTH